MTPRKPERPIFWIVAGPNGSGKSTLYNRTDIEGWGGSVWIINPDLLTAKIQEQEGLTLALANGVALDRIESWLYASLETYQTIGVETVLSSDKYRKLIDQARIRGFETRMLYVVVDSLDVQLGRIRERVSAGGHDVPADKVKKRRANSFAQLVWFSKAVDQCFVFDNSGGSPELIAEKTGDGMACWRELPGDLKTALAAGGLRLSGAISDLD